VGGALNRILFADSGFEIIFSASRLKASLIPRSSHARARRIDWREELRRDAVVYRTL